MADAGQRPPSMGVWPDALLTDSVGLPFPAAYGAVATRAAKPAISPAAPSDSRIVDSNPAPAANTQTVASTRPSTASRSAMSRSPASRVLPAMKHRFQP